MCYFGFDDGPTDPSDLDGPDGFMGGGDEGGPGEVDHFPDTIHMFLEEYLMRELNILTAGILLNISHMVAEAKRRPTSP
jgi:hypothetical protein